MNNNLLFNVPEAINKILENYKVVIVPKDSQPVQLKHGHWDDMGDFEQCSVCHGTHLKEYQTYYGKCLWVKTDYCPHCGAKMDEHIDTPTDPVAK